MNAHFYRDFLFILHLFYLSLGCADFHPQTSESITDKNISYLSDFIKIKFDSYPQMISADLEARVYQNPTDIVFDQNFYENQSQNIEEQPTDPLSLEWIYSLTDRALYLRPVDGFRPLTWYHFILKDHDQHKVEERWRTSGDLSLISIETTPPPDSAFKEMIEASCSCHQIGADSNASQLWDGTLKSAVGKQSALRPEWRLLTPGVPLSSLLFLMALSDYPLDVPAMPPSPHPPLDRDALWRLERWILSL